jgi:hypothetical protein
MSVESLKSGFRLVQHKSHLCIIEYTVTHVKHNGFRRKQAHYMFKSYCELHPSALHYDQTDIMNWLKNENIDTLHEQVHEDTGEATSVDSLCQMVTDQKRFTTDKVKKLDKDIDVAGNYPESQLLVMCQKYSLGATVSRLGELHFDTDTSYIIPGWSSSADRQTEVGDMYVMVFTINLALNYSRVMRWNKDNVTLALDHTYKMDKRGNPHFSVNVIVPRFGTMHRSLSL